ncbi:MAG: TonB family protein [Candidatus Acidiferrales bacterium]|jgi:TonB family protein
MESPWKKAKNWLNVLVERDPASAEFRSGVRAANHRDSAESETDLTKTDLTKTDLTKTRTDGFALWSDVFVEQELPWRRFLQSALLHTAAVVLIWIISLAWVRQQKILEHSAFDRASLITFSPQEYLKPLDTGASEAPKTQKGDPVYAKQPIISVPREADNRAQTIVAPPDLKLNKDVALPNIVATGAVAPTVPLDATRTPLTRINAPETQVVAPAPEVEFAPDRVVRTAIKSDVIAPPPELTQSSKGQVGLMNINPSDVVAPPPQLALTEQHTLARGKGHLPGGSIQPVAPPPSMAASGGASAGGRLVALGMHPVSPNGPVAAPAGNRRGAFAATPQGKAGASGTPDLSGSKAQAKGMGSRGDSTGLFARNTDSLPAGLHVGAAGSNRDSARDASVLPDEKLTDLDRQVFGDKPVHSMTLNMPNLNSATGSWVIKFAELGEGNKEGSLTPPESKEKLDPGYPLALIRANVHGMVTLYAVIKPDGNVGSVRVLNSPDDRLDSYAAKALASCKFQPAVRGGKPVALEAVVVIPFRVHRNNF